LTPVADSYNLSITQGQQTMPRKLTNKQIEDGINKVAENYFKASCAKGMPESTRNYLTNKWANFRELAVLLSQKNPKSLEEFIFTSQGWLVSAEQIAAEAVE
jgi:hypothetical protein